MADAEIIFHHNGYTVRQWKPIDREPATRVIKQCLESYGLNFEPDGADCDALEVEVHYIRNKRGEFWVVVDDLTGELIGTAGYYELEVSHDEGAVEVRKMYLLPQARGKKLGRALLETLEGVIKSRGYRKIIVETASVLLEAQQLYKSAGYLSIGGVETKRCDIRLYKNI